MLIYVGKLTYSPYAADELITIVFRDNVQTGDMAAVVLQWSKDSDGKAKANFSNHGTVSKVSATGPMEKNIELFSDEKDKTYYWYKGKISGDKMTLAMFNRGGEEVTKKIELQLVFF